MQEAKYGCQEVVDLLSDYIDGECSKNEEALIKAHLSDCSDCIAFVNTFRKSLVMTRALDCSDIPKELQIRLQRVLERKIPMEDSPPDVQQHPFDQPGRAAEDEKRR